MVFYKTDYEFMEKAVDFKDGLLVLAFFFEVRTAELMGLTQPDHTLQEKEILEI